MEFSTSQQPSNRPDYNTDHDAWLAFQIENLQQGELAVLDIAHLVEELEGLTRSNKQRLVWLILFGSYARGDFKPSSDIDVLVVLKPSMNWQVDSGQVTEFTSDISIETGELLSSVFMNEDEFQRSPELLLVKVRREGIAL